MFTVITNKNTLVRIFCDGQEINYDNAANYRNYYVANVGIGEEDKEPCLVVDISETSIVAYLPNL
ncbi:MAG: hypothetical protein RSF40_01495 [Oscillospiraceae bacterium]